MDENLKEEYVKLLESLKNVIEKTNKGFNTFGKELSTNEERLKALNNQFTQAQTGIKQLSREFREGAVDVEDAFKQVQGLNRALIRSGHAIDKETALRIKEIESAFKRDQAMTFFNNTIESATKNIIDFGIAAGKTVVSELQGTGNAFGMVTKVMQQGIDSTLNFTRTMTSAAESAGGALASLPGKLGIAGAVIQLGAKLIRGAAEKSAEIAKFGLEVLNAEVQKTITVFTNNSKAGIFFGNGMTALTKELHGAGVDYRDFFGALQGVNQQLTMIGGSAGRGAEQVSRTFKAMEPFRRGLLNLGISIEEQVQGAAEYMSILAQSGKLQGKSSTDLAKGTDEYLTNLRAITSITGEEAKAAQARARKAADQLAVQTTLNKLDGEARVKFQNAITQLPATATTAVQQMLTLGTVTGETAAAFAQTPAVLDAIKQYASDIKDPTVGATDAMTKLYKVIGDPATREQLQSVGEPFGNAALAIGKLTTESELLADMLKLNMKLQGVSAEEALERARKQKETTDPLTNSISEATEQFQIMQQKLEENLNPAITNFAGFVEQQIVQQAARIKDAMDALFGTRGSDQPSANVNFGTTRGQEGDPFGAVTGRALPRKALGGIVRSPSIAGEAGPEAVVPLPDGRTIPTNLDLSPLASAMSQQVQLTAELLDEIKNSNYIQEKILVASQ